MCRECQTGSVLVVFSGLPGVGKSAIADALGRRIGACVVSVDPIEEAILRGGITQSFETGVAAYRVAASVAEHQLRNGLTVIVDAANYLEVGRDIWRGVAKATGARTAIVQVMCSNTAEHRHRLHHRVRGMDAFPEPTWHDVERRATETEPWNEPHLVVDSVQPVETSVAAIVAYLAHRSQQQPSDA